MDSQNSVVSKDASGILLDVLRSSDGLLNQASIAAIVNEVLALKKVVSSASASSLLSAEVNETYADPSTLNLAAKAILDQEKMAAKWTARNAADDKVVLFLLCDPHRYVQLTAKFPVLIKLRKA